MEANVFVIVTNQSTEKKNVLYKSLTQENHIPEHGLFISQSTTTENETDQSFKKCIKRSLTTLKFDIEHLHKHMDIFKSTGENLLIFIFRGSQAFLLKLMPLIMT